MKPTIIFVAEDDINTGPYERGSEQHFWLFSSTKLEWQHMPQPFLESFGKWYARYHATWSEYVDQRMVMATIVQPTGQYVDISPAVLGLTIPVKPAGTGSQ